jgi:bidirectional [NiFe] hydrogenase diaphorase subunit
MPKKNIRPRPKRRAPAEHASGDERYLTLDRTIRQFGYQKDALLEVLNIAQQSFGYLSEDLLIYISQQLNVSLARVYGVATFYHLFTFTPLGKNNCIVCTGTACHVKGADEIVSTLTEAYQLNPGETTPDGLFSLTTARCLGSCGLAPVIVWQNQVQGKETATHMLDIVQEQLAQEKVNS